MNRESVILFDGVCNLCNWFVRFVISRDKKNRFVFASLQSVEAKELLTDFDSSNDLKTVVLIEKDVIYTRSTAALRICRKLSGAWPILYGFIIIPIFIRNAVYSFIARNRYHWFGKKDHCMIPTPELQKKFLDHDVTKQKNTCAGSQ